MDLELIKQIFTDKETSKKWDEFFYDGMHKDFFVNTKEEYYEAFVEYANLIVSDLKKARDPEKVKWLTNFINIYLYDFSLTNPELVHFFDLFYEIDSLNIKEEDYNDFKDSLEAINFEDLMTKQILNQDITLDRKAMLKYLALFLRNDVPITDFLYSDNALEIIEYVESSKKIVFSESFLKMMSEKPVLGYNLLFNELYRDKNEILNENVAKERVVLNAITCRDVNYYYDNYLATNKKLHLCSESIEAMTIFIEENAPDKLEEYKKLVDNKSIGGSLRTYNGKVYELEKLYEEVYERLVSSSRFEVVLSKNKNLGRYYNSDGTLKVIKIDHDFIEKMVKTIFTDKETYEKFSNFEENRDFFGEYNSIEKFIFEISNYAQTLLHEKAKLSDLDKKWLVNYLEYISSSFTKDPLVACAHKIFDSYDKKIIINSENKQMVLEVFERMNYKKEVEKVRTKLDPKKPNQYSSDDYARMFAFLSSNENNMDIRTIRTFFACFLNETMKINNEEIIMTYIRALTEKLLAKKGINAKCHFEDLGKTHGRHIMSESSTILINKSNVKGGGKDAFHVLKTVFHEMRHAVQISKIKNHEMNYAVLQWTKERILRHKHGQQYYEKNYLIYVPEIDARLAGNIYLKRFLKDVAPSLLTEEFELELSREISLDNSLKSALNRVEDFSREEEYKVPMDFLVAEALKNDPKLVESFQVLKMEYRPDGSRKKTGEIYKEYKEFDDEKLKKSYFKLMSLRSIDLDDLVSDLKSIATLPLEKTDELSEIIKLFRQVLKKNYISEINRHRNNGNLDFVAGKISKDLELIGVFLDSQVMVAASLRKPFKHLELLYQMFLEDKKFILNSLELKQKYSQTMKK